MIRRNWKVEGKKREKETFMKITGKLLNKYLSNMGNAEVA